MPRKTPTATGRLTAKARFHALQTKREPFLQRAREASKLTIPSLIPEQGTSAVTKFVQAYQSFGARAVNNLAAKLLLALFPPNTPYFRLKPDKKVEQTLAEAGAGDAKGEIEAKLREVEDAVLTRLEQKGARRTLHECLKHLLVAGNVLLDIMDDSGMRLHPLSRYVVKRDGQGNPFEIVAIESLDRRTIDEKVLALLPEKTKQEESEDQSVEVYTRALLKGGKWRVWQEIEEIEIPDSEGTYPKDACPLIPLRWTKQDGEDYGRSHVEDYAGDMRSLESLSKSITLLAAALAKILIFVNENGVTSIDDVATAESLDVLPGDAKDITTLQLEKQADLRVAKEQAADLKRELGAAFLLYSSVQRDAERVTAEEIRLLAGELEQAIGGNYAVLAQEMQHPLVAVYLNVLKREGKIKLPEKFVTTQIITGLEALGRNSEAERLRLIVRETNELLGPGAAKEFYNVPALINRLGTSYGVELKGIVKTDDEVRDQQAQAIAADIATNAAPKMLTQQQQPQQPAA